MTFSEIYRQVLPYWGLEIEFSDGEFIDLGDDEMGFSSDRFATLWNGVEKEVGYGNTYHELMVWTMYQVFHQHARTLFEKDVFFLIPQEIDAWEIEEQYFLNLSEPIWKNELANYERE